MFVIYVRLTRSAGPDLKTFIWHRRVRSDRDGYHFLTGFAYCVKVRKVVKRCRFGRIPWFSTTGREEPSQLG